ncbi:hypothetical protein CI102_2180 [Trichoderma harzianum]|nr:hypothetical protein CI102_2180 [Trichoderma harzianum]
MAAPLELRACKSCAKSKRKCDKQMLFCQRCKDAGIDCVYPPPRQSSYVLLNDCHLSNEAAGLPKSSAGIREIGDVNTATQSSAVDLSVDLSIHSHQRFSAHSPSDWFLSPETWKIEPYPIHINPNMNLFSSSMLKRYVSVIQHWLKSWVMSGSNPFIHPQLYRTRFPTCVQVAYTTLSAYINRTETNSEIILRIIESQANELVSNTDISVNDVLESLDPLEHLARAHALMVYQIICLFDGDIRSRHLAEGRANILVRWVTQMVECASSSLYLLSLTLDPLDLVETTSPVNPSSVTGGTEHLWHTWILAESIRRTWLTATGLQALYLTLQQGWAFCPGGMMFTTRRGVWEAKTAFAWERLCLETDIGFIQRFETEKLFTEASPLEIDEFGKMILESTYGTERMERWTQ